MFALRRVVWMRACFPAIMCSSGDLTIRDGTSAILDSFTRQFTNHSIHIRSEMNEYELRDHSHRKALGKKGRIVAIFLFQVTFIHQDICYSYQGMYTQQPFYLSYTSCGLQCFTLSRRGSLNGDLAY